MELKEIQNLIKFISKSDISEVSLKTDEFEIKVKTGKASSVLETHTPIQIPHPEQITIPSKPSTLTTGSKEDTTQGDSSKYYTFKSPMIGTFYQKPSPDKPNFINVGDTIQNGTTLCIIEAMKLFNEIESEVDGKILKILVEDSSPVEFDQPLFLIDPS